MKFKIQVSIWVFVLIFVQGYAQDLLIDKVIARVGSEQILLSEIEEEFSYYKSKDPSVSEDMKCALLESMIEQKLVIYHAKIDSVEVSDEEVELQLDFRFESVLRQMNGDEAFFEDYYGASIEEMKNRYRDDQRHKLLAEKMQYELLADIDITPKEVEIFYNSIPRDSLPYFKSEMEISEIIMVPKVNETERQKALDKITELYEKVVSGQEKFDEIAAKYSQDPGSAVKGGDLGFARRGVFVEEFEATVFSLAKNEISDIIETEFGFHFIQLLERRGNSVRARHVLIKPEITATDLNLTKTTLDSVRTLVASDSLTFIQAVKKHSLPQLPSYSNNGRVKNPNTNNTFFSANDLDPDTYFVVIDLKVGEISKPMEIKMPDGQKAYRLVQLNSTTKPHRANLNEDYDKISNFAKENKKNEHYMKWIRDKKAKTFISIDDLYAHCANKLKG